MPPRKQDIPEAVFDLLVELRLRLQEPHGHPLAVKKSWYQDAKARCGPRTAQLVLWLIESGTDVGRPELNGPPTLAPSSLAKTAATDPMTSEEPEGAGVDYLAIVRQAIKAVPSVRYALGIAGIAAVVALIVGWSVDIRIALAGIVAMFVLMTVLVVFAWLTKLRHPQMTSAALFLMWSFVVLLVTWACLLTSSVFFNYPKSPDQLFGPAKAA